MSLLFTILLLGLAASLSPSTIVVFILLLATTRARLNAVAFLTGWTISLVVVFSVSYVIGGAHELRQGGGRAGVAAAEILLGLTLAWVGLGKWRRRSEPRPTSRFTKDLTDHLERVGPKEATVVGIFEQPWTLTAAAALVLVRDGAALIVVVLAFAVFTVASTATVGLTFLYYSRRPGEAKARLAGLRDRVVAAGPVLFALVSLAVGAYLVLDGVLSL